LSIAEFAYNSSVNRTTCKSQHEIVYDFRPRQPIDLVPMVDHYRVSESVSSFITHMHELHKIINDKIKQNNFNYKLKADVRRKLKTFDIGDLVMVRIRSEWFPPGTVKKLQTSNAGPFKILMKLNDNAYVNDLLENFRINPTFNIEDLLEYKGLNFNPSISLVNKPTTVPFLRDPHFSHSQISVLIQ